MTLSSLVMMNLKSVASKTIYFISFKQNIWGLSNTSWELRLPSLVLGLLLLNVCMHWTFLRRQVCLTTILAMDPNVKILLG